MTETAFRPSERLSALVSGRLDHYSPEESQLMLLRTGRELVRSVNAAHRAEGNITSPIHELLEEESHCFLAKDEAQEKRLRSLRAREVNITRTFYEHHAWRHENEANVVVEVCGPTGSGKSSCMLGLLETLNRVRPSDLRGHLTIDVPDLPHILPTLTAGSGLVVDEQPHLVGEGSITQLRMLASVEEQIRQSGIDLYFASPTARDHATSQARLVAFRWNRKKRYTCFVLVVEDYPLGYVKLPWCSPEMWTVYQEIKADNVQRALRAAFQDPDAHDTRIKKLFEIEAVQAICRVHRPKVPHWKRIVRRFVHALSVSETSAMAEEADFMLETLASRPEEFRIIYGWDPTPAMLQAASAAPASNRRGAPG